jgi:hypothetical protein
MSRLRRAPTPVFDFRQDRLVDQDADGWWEYLPTPPKDGVPVAPFVYFDYVYYGSISKLDAVPYPSDPKLAGQIGTVVPLAAYFDPTGKQPSRWQNPQSFQILCGGLDGKYSAPNAPARITVFPAGYTYLGPSFNGPPGDYDRQELDNVTTLSIRSLGEAQAEAR